MEKAERLFRLFLMKKCSKEPTNNVKGVNSIEEDEKAPGNYRQFYLLFHHVGYYFYLFAYSGFLESMENNSFLFYIILLTLCTSLDYYYLASKDPGFVTKEPEDTTDLHFCEVCQLHCPIRACHCRACGRCVKRRDHHCPWTNCCIGRDNHAYFIIWLMLESVVMILVNGDILLSLAKPRPVSQWFAENAGLLVIFALTMFDLVFVLWLSYGHWVMLMHNNTVWEQKRRDRISYLKDLPLSMNPFDNGIVQNVIEFFTMRHTNKEWGKPRAFSIDDIFTEKRIACERAGLDPTTTMPSAMAKTLSMYNGQR